MHFSIISRVQHYSIIIAICAMCIVVAPPPAEAGFEEAMSALKRGEFSIFWREFKQAILDSEDKANQQIDKLKDIKGMAVPLQEYSQAFDLVTRAIEQNDVNAMTELGTMYATGTAGVRPDRMLAYAWFTLAIEMGGGSKNLPDVVKMRDDIGKDLSSDQMDMALSIVKEIKEAIQP